MKFLAFTWLEPGKLDREVSQLIWCFVRNKKHGKNDCMLYEWWLHSFCKAHRLSRGLFRFSRRCCTLISFWIRFFCSISGPWSLDRQLRRQERQQKRRWLKDRQISTCDDNPGNLRLTFLLLTIELITGVFIEQSCPAALFIALSLGQFDLGPESTLGRSDIPVTLFLVTWKKREGCGVAEVEVYLAHGKHARVLGFLTL